MGRAPAPQQVRSSERPHRGSTDPSQIPPELQRLSDASNSARERWRLRSNEVRHMGDENCGWGTDSQYRAAARVRDELWAAYELAWAAFARAFNAHFGGKQLLDPENAT